MSIEERALSLINNAMQRIQSSIKNPIALSILHQVSAEQNLLLKISNLIHLLAICNQKQFYFSDETYENIKKKYPHAPSDPNKLANWLISFINHQEIEIQNFRSRLIQIELIIKKISLKINNKNNPLNEQINDLKQKIQIMEKEKEQKIKENNELKQQMLNYKEKIDQNQKEFLLLKDNKLESHKASQTTELILEEVKKSKELQQEGQYKDLKEKMQFQIDSLIEKCSLMRNDLNYALKQKFEFENNNLTLQDELQRKNAEVLSLQAIINDMKASYRK